MSDIITELREERRGYAVTVNDSEVFHLSWTEARLLALRQGQEIDLEAFKKDLLVQQYPEALNRAVGYLATRAHSSHEIEQKLEQKRYIPDTVEMVMYKLEKERLLDDAAFAKAWVASRTNRGLGKARIKQELRMKGIDESMTEEAFAALDDDAAEDSAAQLAARLLRRYDKGDARETMRKSIMAMQRRGYSYGDASKALQQALENAEVDEDDEDS